MENSNSRGWTRDELYNRYKTEGDSADQKNDPLERIAQSLETLVHLKELELKLAHCWQKPPNKKKLLAKELL